MQGPSYTIAGFMVMAFAVVGLTGFLAAHVSAVPLHRALVREAVLDRALAASRQPDAAAAIEALRPQLGESAAALLPVGADIAERIAAERVAMRARRLAEAAEASLRMRAMLAVVTVLAAGFAAMLVLAGRRREPEGKDGSAGKGPEAL